MALNFPSSPSSGQKHSENGTSWEWDGSSWNRVTGLISTDAGTLVGIGLTQFARRDQNNVITGINTFVGDVKIEGVLTYEDVKNIDSIGIVTARTGVRIKADGSSSANYLSVGASDDIKIYHDNNTKIENSTGYLRVASTTGLLYLDGNSTHIRSGDGGETQAKFIDDGAVELYHNNSKHFETTNLGAKVTGLFESDAIKIQDNGQGASTLIVATDDEIPWALHLRNDTYHNGGTSGLKILQNNAGSVYQQIRGNTEWVQYDIQQHNGSGTRTLFRGTTSSAVELFYASSKKLETTNTGATVTGTLTATAFSGNLTGNVTGNTSGSSGSCTGNAATASVATNVTVADESSDTSCNVLFATAATGNLPPKTGTNLTFNSSTGQLTATSYAGDGSNLTGIDATAIQTGNTSVQTATYSITNTVANVGIVTIQPSGLTVSGISTFTGDVYFDGATAGRDIWFDRSDDTLKFNDAAKAKFGTGGDLVIQHDGYHSYIAHNGAGDLYIRASWGDKIRFQKYSGGETLADFNCDGSIDLYYDGSKKFETTNTGATVTGTLTATAFSGPLTGNVTGNTSGSSGSCTGNAATATALQNARTIGGVSFDGTANINLPGVNAAGNQNTTGTAAGLTGTPSIAVNSVTGVAATFTGNLVVGGVLTYEDVTNVDSVGIVTARAGVNISGGNLQVGGTNVINSGRALYNVESVKLADAKNLILGTSDDLKIYHSGTHSFISEEGQGALKVKGDDIRFENASGTEAFRIDSAGRVMIGTSTEGEGTADDLTIATSGSTGITIRSATNSTGNIYFSDGTSGNDETMGYFQYNHGNNNLSIGVNNGTRITITDTETSFTGNINLSDTKKLNLGASGDFQLFHDGTNNEIMATNGPIHCYSGANIEFRKGWSGSYETILKAIPNGAVELYHDNSLKLHTASDGVTAVGYINNQHLRGGSGDMYVGNAAQGDLYIYVQDNTNNSIILQANTGEKYLEAKMGGAVDLYHHGSKKFNTHTDGIEVLGKLYMADNKIIELGNSQDLKIYHNGSHSYIDNLTGNLYFRGSNGQMLFRPNNSEDALVLKPNGAVELYYDNALRLSTASGGVNVAGNLNMNGADGYEIRLGASNDLKLYHDGSHSVIEDTGTGHLYVKGSEVFITGHTTGETLAQFVENSGCYFRYDNTVRLETTSAGISVTGRINLSDNLDMPDNAKVIVGTGDDIKIYHDGTHSYIRNDTNQFYCQAQNNFYIQHHNAGSAIEDMLIARGDGAVELYYDDVKTFETVPNGVKIVGSEGNYSYLYMHSDEGDDDDDKWRIEVGNSGAWKLANFAGGGWENNIVCNGNGDTELFHNGNKKLETYSGGINVTGYVNLTDSQHLRLGTGNDLQAWHDGTNSFLTNSTGAFLQRADDIRLQNSAGSEVMLDATANGAVKLYYDNTERFRTNAGGAQIFGNIYSQDNCIHYFGDGNDLQIYHNGSDSVISDAGTGNLNIYTNGAGVNIQKSNGENMARFFTDGACELFYDNAKTFETISGGATVTGQLYVTAELNLINGSSNAAKYIDCGLGDNNALTIRGTSGGDTNHETLARFIRNGACELYYDNVKKLNTESSGVSISAGHLYIGDNYKAQFGGSQDLQIWHSGSHSYIQDLGTGNLAIGANDLHLMNAATTEHYIKCTENGSVELFHNNNKKLETTTNGGTLTGDWFMTTNGYLSFPNNVQALFGTGTLMRIYHNGSNAIISNSTGYLNIESNNGFLYLDGTSVHIRVGAQGGEESAVVCNQNGSVDLYYDNSKRFETRTGGTRIYGKGQGTTFSAGQGMHAEDRCGLEVQGALTGIKIASTYNDASHPEYGLVFVQGPSTSSFNCWSISPDGPARGNNLRFHYQAQSSNIHVGTNCKVYMTGNGDWIPYHGNTSDLGTSSKRWNNLYVNDMHFSNEGKDGGNDVDGTTGDWTLQEGETDIYMINNKTGKKYKIALQEVN